MSIPVGTKEVIKDQSIYCLSKSSFQLQYSSPSWQPPTDSYSLYFYFIINKRSCVSVDLISFMSNKNNKQIEKSLYWNIKSYQPGPEVYSEFWVSFPNPGFSRFLIYTFFCFPLFSQILSMILSYLTLTI